MTLSMVRCLGHRNLATIITYSRHGARRCFSEDSPTTTGDKDIEKPKDEEESLSAKMAKPVGRMAYKSNRMPGMAPPQLDISEVTENLDHRLMKAAKMVAKSMSDDKKSAKRTEAELQFMIKSSQMEKDAAKAGEQVRVDVLGLLQDFKIEKIRNRDLQRPDKFIEREQPSDFQERSQDGRQRRGGQGDFSAQLRRARRKSKPIGIYSAESYGIFNLPEGTSSEPTIRLNTWDALRVRELELLMRQPPRNAFEEMIQWTEDGKLWHYPINNEQGLDEEAKVPFYEHIFLDHLLEGFPTKGPIRQFMEIVIMGLSRNPYITAERKKQTVQWFKVYFDQKKDIIQRTGIAATN